MPRQPRKRHVIRDADQLGVMVSPVRHHLLRTLSTLGPVPVRELAERLDRSPESLYYHLRALEGASLVRRHETRVRNGRSEVIWASVARGVYTDPDQTSPDYVEAMQRSASSLLRLADRQVHAALELQKETGSRRPPSLRCMQVHVRLAPAAVRELARRLDDLIAFIEESDDPEAEKMVAVTLASAPIPGARGVD